MSIVRYCGAYVNRTLSGNADEICYHYAMSISFLAWGVPTAVAVTLLWVVARSGLLWRKRRLVGEAVISLFLAGMPFLFLTPFILLVQVLLVIVEAWMIVLGARLVFGRLSDDFLRMSTKLNASIAVLFVLLVFGAWMLVAAYGRPPAEWVAGAILGVAACVAIAFIMQALWTLRHYNLPAAKTSLPLAKLPTVTLAIPARNETAALTETLQHAVASDYPKLEIIVLDDCSQDTTSQLVRSFAHDGVRFVQGEVPADGWLGKNQALELLARHANGEYIIFTGVDTHLAPQSITAMIQYALGHNSSMISVLPQWRAGLHWSSFAASLRYYWQIVLPVTRHRIPVASQCWLMRADALRHLGGFAAVRHKIVPEGSFARRLFAVGMYRFVVSDAALGVTTAKKWYSQNETAMRFLYPTFKRQPLYTLMGTLMLAGALLGPFVLLGVSIVNEALQMWIWPAACACALLLLSYVLVVVRTHPGIWLVTLFGYPVSLLQELVLMVLSMMAYEFGEVNWKGRNVCYPVIMPQGYRAGRRTRK